VNGSVRNSSVDLADLLDSISLLFSVLDEHAAMLAILHSRVSMRPVP